MPVKTENAEFLQITGKDKDKIKQVQDIFLAQGRDVEQILVVPEVAVVGIHFGHTPGFFEVDMDGGFFGHKKTALVTP